MCLATSTWPSAPFVFLIFSAPAGLARLRDAPLTGAEIAAAVPGTARLTAKVPAGRRRYPTCYNVSASAI